MLGKDLEKERTFLNPQNTRKKTEDSSVFSQSFVFSINNMLHPNSFRMRVEEGATDLLDRTHFLRNVVPDHKGSGKVPPLNVSIRGWPRMQKVPPKVTKELLFGLADFFLREHTEIRS